MNIKRFIIALILPIFVVFSSHAAWESGKRSRWGATDTTGGGTGALDTISGASMGPYDTAMVIDMASGNPLTGATVHFYQFKDSGTTNVENDPTRIVPDTQQAGGGGDSGTSTWELVSSGVSRFTAYGLATFLSGLTTTEITFPDGTTISTDQVLSGTSGQIPFFDNSGALVGQLNIVKSGETVYFVDESGETKFYMPNNASVNSGVTFIGALTVGDNRYPGIYVETSQDASGLSGDSFLVFRGNKGANDSEVLGYIYAANKANSGTDYLSGIQLNKVYGSTDAGALAFLTQPSGGALTERMNIGPDGGVTIYNPDGSGGSIFQIDPSGRIQGLYPSGNTTELATRGLVDDQDHSDHGDGGNCAAGEIPLGVDADGAVQGCYEPAEADITDLAHVPTVGDFGNAVALVASGNIASSGVTDDHIDWSGTTTSALSGATGGQANNVQTQINSITGQVANHSDTTATGAELEELTDGSETTLHSHAGGGAGGSGATTIRVDNNGTITETESGTIDDAPGGFWYVPDVASGASATAVSGGTIYPGNLDATPSQKGVATFNTANFSVSSGDVTIADNGINNDEIDFSSGITVASAVSKFVPFSISNPQDWGGGSASSPFLIGHFPAEIYPNGVYLIFLKVRNTAVGSQSSDIIFSEHNGGVSEALVGVLTTSANTWVKDSSVSGPVIDADNDLFAEAVSGVCAMAGGYAFIPR